MPSQRRFNSWPLDAWPLRKSMVALTRSFWIADTNLSCLCGMLSPA